jgi:uncharacterized repeat protein (TIGR03803 family)
MRRTKLFPKKNLVYLLLPVLLFLARLCFAQTSARTRSGQPAAEVVLHNFAVPPKGAHPEAAVIRDSAGNLYGTTTVGGTSGHGVVYKVDTAGQETVLYAFKGRADGGFPYAGVIRDSAGNLYGTTNGGGTSGWGVVYKLDTAGKETVLYSFTGGADGGIPYAGVIRDAAGNLYGTTYAPGVVYKLDTAGKQTVLYSFTGEADGASPVGGVVRDSAGNLYGTTVAGGTSYTGVVYKVDKSGQETVLYSFTGGADGGIPYSGVIRDAAGNLYGTTTVGGTSGHGVVYKVDKSGQETVLYSFTGEADGGEPDYAGVIRDSAGNLYGTTYYGGTAGCGGFGCGVVYKLDTAGQETVLYSFKGGADGAGPAGGVVRDAAGTFYGTTSVGGPARAGVVFTLNSAGQETILYRFRSHDGYSPAAVIRDSAGNLYGTTRFGGTSDAGTLYEVDTAGKETVLYSFTGGTDGGNPLGGVVRDSAGNLYGTTNGGTSGWGVVYKLDTAGKETVLYSFTGGTDGGNPLGGVVRDSAGNLYGTTNGGGTSGWGVVYKLDTAGKETVLYSFTGGADGGETDAGVIRDSAGNLYGTTVAGGTSYAGVVYKVDTAGTETVLYNFTGGSDGGPPVAGVIRDAAGNLYGTTNGGGTSGTGVVYELDTAGQETVLYSFKGGADGAGPAGGVVRDAAGNLYGATYFGGTSNAGVVYKLNTTDKETVLHSFTGGKDGGGPSAGVILDAAGNLYGTATVGGSKGGGVLFEIKPSPSPGSSESDTER